MGAELLSRGVSNFRFVRVPADYYSRDLEYRRGVLDAASTAHLCKTIIMENTKLGEDDERLPSLAIGKYFMVVVQYEGKSHSEKLKVIIHRANNGVLSRKQINPRLVAEEKSDELSGFRHNAVTPINIKTPMPIIMSDQITQLQPDFFFLGAGEVDLKVGLPAAEFVAAFKPLVVDISG